MPCPFTGLKMFCASHVALDKDTESASTSGESDTRQTNMFLINEQIIRLLEEGELCDGIKIYKRTDKTKVLIINQRIFDVKSLNTVCF